MNTFLFTAGLFSVLVILYCVRVLWLRHKTDKVWEDLEKRFPRRPLSAAFLISFVLFQGCNGRLNLGTGTVTLADPSNPTDPSSGGGPGGTPSAGDPVVIEVQGCANTFSAPQQYQPLTCQLKQPVQIGDSIKVISWTQAAPANANRTPAVSDANQSVYASVVSVAATGSTNNTVWIANSVSPLASPSLNVTVDPLNANVNALTGNTTVEDIVLVHSRGAVTFRNVVSSGCLAPPSPSSANGITSQTCLPIQASQVTPNTNDLILAVFLSNEPVLDQMSISTSALNPPMSLAWCFSNAGSFAVGYYIAPNTTPIQPSFSINTGQGTFLNTNFGWEWSALVASFN